MSATAAKTNGRGPRVPVATPSPLPEPKATAAARERTPSLDAAVLRVQAAAGKLMRNADGQVGSRSYRYVTLDAVTDEVLPLLVEEQLLWKTFPTALDGEPALRYRMTHVPSGEFDEDTMLLLCDRTSQGQGSGDTYARRYSLVAYLNLTVDPDDDGASANPSAGDAPQASQAPASAPSPASPQPTAAAPKASERPATVKQRNMVKARARAAKLEASEFAAILVDAGDGAPRVWADDEAAQRWVDRALDRLPASRVDAVLEGIKSAGEGR